MKKSLAVVLIFMVLVPLFASQELYTANSYEVQTFKSLKRISGDNVVEPTYPISGTQLLQLLENLDTSSMNSKALSVFNNLVYGLEHSNDRFYEYEAGASAKNNVIPGVTVQGSLGWVGSFKHNYFSGNVFSDVQASLGVKLDAGAILDHYVGWRLK